MHFTEEWLLTKYQLPKRSFSYLRNEIWVPNMYILFCCKNQFTQLFFHFSYEQSMVLKHSLAKEYFQ